MLSRLESLSMSLLPLDLLPGEEVIPYVGQIYLIALSAILISFVPIARHFKLPIEKTESKIIIFIKKIALKLHEARWLCRMGYIEGCSFMFHLYDQYLVMQTADGIGTLFDPIGFWLSVSVIVMCISWFSFVFLIYPQIFRYAFNGKFGASEPRLRMKFLPTLLLSIFYCTRKLKALSRVLEPESKCGE